MARKRANRRHRRSRFGFLYKLLTVLVICGVIVAALTLFFKVQAIEVSGNVRYTEEEIRAATGVETGDNLFLLNKYDVKERLFRDLPYIVVVDRISRRLPDTLEIEVTECRTTFAVVQGADAWLISPGGKIVEQAAAAEATEIPRITGCTLKEPAVGELLTLDTERQTQADSLLALLAALEDWENIGQVTSIDLSGAAEIVMGYAGRFDVQLPYGADYEKLLRFLDQAVNILETNETGTIDLTTEGAARIRKDR